MKYLSIYVHIPFCIKKCDYCNFTSFSCCEQKFENYFLCLENEIKQKANLFCDRIINTIFIGGGTPSLVPANLIEKLMKTIKQSFNLTKTCEITIECNPDSTNKEKLQLYKKCGINRISFGVQTLNNNLLKLIGRPHNSIQALSVIKTAKQVGFKNINADVMLGLPLQSKQIALSTIKELIETGINHISLYTLILEENTPLYNKVHNNEVILPSEDEIVKMFSLCQNYIKKQGFTRYEVANFSKNKKFCRHNLGYWQNADYIGFGVSAHSKIGNKRFCNTSNLTNYLNNNNRVETDELSAEQIREEKIMLGLRTSKGIPIHIVKNKQQLKMLKKNKFIEIKNNRVCATQKGFYVLNQIILMLV